MCKENLVPAAVLLKISKLQTLANRGVDGEAQNAQRVLEALCEKYGLALEDLCQEEKQVYIFPLRSSISNLFANCFSYMFDANIRYKEDFQTYQHKSKIWAELNLTPSEYIEFSQFWEWHKHNFLKERAVMRETFKRAYIEKHQLFAKDFADEVLEELNNRDKPTPEELAAIEALMSTLKDKTYHKQISNSTNAYDKEEEE